MKLTFILPLLMAIMISAHATNESSKDHGYSHAAPHPLPVKNPTPVVKRTIEKTIAGTYLWKVPRDVTSCIVSEVGGGGGGSAGEGDNSARDGGKTVFGGIYSCDGAPAGRGTLGGKGGGGYYAGGSSHRSGPDNGTDATGPFFGGKTNNDAVPAGYPAGIDGGGGGASDFGDGGNGGWLNTGSRPFRQGGDAENGKNGAGGGGALCMSGGGGGGAGCKKRTFELSKATLDKMETNGQIEFIVGKGGAAGSLYGSGARNPGAGGDGVVHIEYMSADEPNCHPK